MQDKISLAGDLGSGKSTVSKILIEALGAEYYHTGGIVRAVAEKHGMTVGELNVYMETHPEIDNEIDDGLRALSEVDKLLIIDSRLAWHFTSGTFKIYLSTDIETSALRIMCANRVGEHAASLSETVAQTRARRASEKKRYMELYGVNIKDLSNYDLIVDTTYATPDEVAEVIINAFRAWQTDKSYRAVYICPERLNMHDEAADSERVAACASCLDSGLDIPTVTVSECDGEFYIRDGEESALAYAFNMNTFIPASLVEYTGNEEKEKFVKIKNSL